MGGFLVAHSPAAEANRRDSLGSRSRPKATTTRGHKGPGTAATRATPGSPWRRQHSTFKGKYCGVHQRRLCRMFKGSDVIRALTCCLRMRLIWIQFPPCVHNVHIINLATSTCLRSRKWKLLPGWAATRPRLTDNRSVLGSSAAHATTNGGKWVRLHKRATGRCRFPLGCSRPPGRASMSVFLG